MRAPARAFMAAAVLCMLTAPALADRVPLELPPCGEYTQLEAEATIFPPSGWDADPRCDARVAPPPGCEGEDLVIGDQETWEYFYGIHKPGVTPPAVDFENKLVVASFTGERRTGGYGSLITCVRYYESELIPGTITHARVEVVDASPGPNCIVTQAFTNPYVIGVIDRPDTLFLDPPPVTFAHEEIVVSCPGGGNGECDFGICAVGGGGEGEVGSHICCPEP